MMVSDTRGPKDEKEALEMDILFFRQMLIRVCLHKTLAEEKRAKEIERLSKKLKDLYAKYNGKPDPRTGVELIAEERKRQIEKEGWTEEHDSEHNREELSILAMLYACPVKYRHMLNPRSWFKTMDWSFSWWKPTDRIKELQKAGALIAAEIDRLKQAE